MATQCDALTDCPEINEDIEGIVFNIQRYSIQDGPGIRTTVFLKGCPLRCLWCSNPESQKGIPEIAHRDALCTACGRCLEACPVKAVSLNNKIISIDRRLCTNCGLCAKVCTPGALNVYGKTMKVREVLEQVKKDVEFYQSSGGGVTVSGGEPLAQSDFVAALFKLCQDRGIDTCIETSGCVSQSAMEKVLPYTSLLLYDIKLSDQDAHQKYTGRSNSDILRNLSLAVHKKVPVIIRIPLIPGINDTEEEMNKIAQIAMNYLQPPRKVNLLPYHRFGMGKYSMLDREYLLPELVTQNDAEIKKLQRIFESLGIECEIVL